MKNAFLKNVIKKKIKPNTVLQKEKKIVQMLDT